VRALMGLCGAHYIAVHRVSATVPPVDALVAARAGFARGAYDAARAAALGNGGNTGYLNQPGGYT
jgi:hypothetical protein